MRVFSFITLKIFAMIRLNCGLIAETEENRRKAIALATELVELSLHDKGCVEYDLVGSLTNGARLRWGAVFR